MVIQQRVLNQRFEFLRLVVTVLGLAFPFEIQAKIDIELGMGIVRPDLSAELV